MHDSKPWTACAIHLMTSKWSVACRGQSVLEAFDFSKVRSKEDAKLLYDARYGKRGEDGKMSKEQYQCVHRRRMLHLA
jgi:hypothetical protein